MYITWLGQACFKIQGREVTIITDPFDKKIGFSLPRLFGDIVTISHSHYDHNNSEAVNGNPVILNTPGEYEIKGVFIRGIPAWHDEKEGLDRGSNIIFLFELEDVKIAHLGDLGTTLSDDQLDKLEGVDVLLIPVGGYYTIDGKKATEVVNQIEPRLVIPMHYKISGLKEKGLKEHLQSVNKFCDEMGVKMNGEEKKIRITKKDLPVEETKVIILKP